MKLSFILLLLVLSTQIYSQIITGTVKKNGQATSGMTIIIKKATLPDIIYQYTLTNKDGFYEIKLKTPEDSLIIETSSVNFKKEQVRIQNVQNKKVHVLNFNLEEMVTELKEVKIFKPITVNKDTTTYNPSSFLTGNEKVIEDLLKKLPGIKVGEDGQITFKGQNIKKFLIDGDDLFDNQYTIGSRNIDVDIVEKIQAVENFEQNSFLKGLTTTDDVALNIVLKKGKTDFSGNNTLGYGIRDKYDASTNNLIITKKLKEFAVASYNNVSRNTSPYDAKSALTSLDQQENSKYLAAKIIRQGDFNSQLANQHHLINQNTFASANVLYKIAPRTTSKINVGFYDDKLKRNTNSVTELVTDDENFIINEVENSIKHPRIFNTDVQILHKTLDSIAIEYLGKAIYEDTKFNSVSSNNLDLQQNFVNTKSIFIKHLLNITKRINAKSAIIAKVLFSNDNAPQNYILSPGFDTNSIQSKNQQLSEFRKQNINAEIKYLMTLQNSKLQFTTGFTSEGNRFYSIFSAKNDDINQQNNTDFNNLTHFDFKVPYFGATYSFSKKKFGVAAGIFSKHYSLSLKNYLTGAENLRSEFVVNPQIKLSYKLTRKESFSLDYNTDVRPPNEKNLFAGSVLTSYRQFENNIVDLDFISFNKYNLSYKFHDIFKLTTFGVSLTYDERENDYFVNNQINFNTTTSTSFLANTKSKNYSLNFNGEKYLHFIRATLQIFGTYFISQRQNVVNNSNPRNIENRGFFMELTARTNTKSFIDFENKTSFTTNRFLLEGATQNNLISLDNNFKTLLKIGNNIKLNSVLSFNSADLSTNNNYWFLDCEIAITSKNKKVNYSIIGRNLTGNNIFSTISISDFSRSEFSYNLVKPFVMIATSFKF